MDARLDRIAKALATRRAALGAIGAAGAVLALPAAEPAAAKKKRCNACCPSKKVSHAQLQVLHASPTAPAVDVYADGSRIAQGLAYAGVTDPTACAPGILRIAVAPEGGDPESPLLELPVRLDACRSYIVALAGAPAETTGRPARSLQGFLYEQDTSRITDAGVARATVIHLSPGVPAINAGLMARDAEGRGAPQHLLGTDLRFGEQSAPVEFPSGDYNVITWDPRGEFDSGGVMELDTTFFEGRETSAIVTLDAQGGTPQRGVTIVSPTRGGRS